MHRALIALADGKAPAVTLDGQALDGVVAVAIIPGPTGPRLQLELAPGALEVAGDFPDVEVVHPDDPDAVIGFLRQIDPAELERLALARLGLDGSADSTGAAMLAQLRRWAGDPLAPDVEDPDA